MTDIDAARLEGARRDHDLSVEELADTLGVSTSTFYRYLRRERIPTRLLVLLGDTLGHDALPAGARDAAAAKLRDEQQHGARLPAWARDTVATADRELAARLDELSAQISAMNELLASLVKERERERRHVRKPR